MILVGDRAAHWQRLAGAGLPVRLGIVFANLCAVFVVAAATYHLVEEPGRKFLRRLAGVGQAPAEAVPDGSARVS